MRTLLTAQSLTLAHSGEPLFSALSFTIQQGNKIGLVGHNGCGKSSLLKLLDGQYEPQTGHVSCARDCSLSYVEQYMPTSLEQVSLRSALSEKLTDDEHWRADLLLEELGFAEPDWHIPVSHCSGGQQMRLLLGRAIINEPNVLLLDEPSNHLDLPALLWLEQFLTTWHGAAVVVSHDDRLLDTVTDCTWIMRDKTLYPFALPCTAARQALMHKDEQDQHRHANEQKEIDRLEKSAKRLAQWGKNYDNEDLARKAKSMMLRKSRLEATQTELSAGTPWRLQLQGEALPANRLLSIVPFALCPPRSTTVLFHMTEQSIKSGDRIAIIGQNGSGKSTLLNLLHHHAVQQQDNSADIDAEITYHQRCTTGYYDQEQQQLNDNECLHNALSHFAPLSTPQITTALIRAGFDYERHTQLVASLSGGERARLLFLGLSLARYHLLLLDEPTNHLDIEGKQELITALNAFNGATIMVSHDRHIIENACNRFWLISQQTLVEYATAEEVYEALTNQHNTQSTKANADMRNRSHKISTDEEEALMRLLELERLLTADRQNKPRHQNIERQQQWEAEIMALEKQLP